MKLIRYKMVGGVGGKTKCEGSLADLFASIPYVGLIGLVPPYEAARDLFLLGVVDGGMSGGTEWPPFDLTYEEYEEFALDLQTYPVSPVTPHGFSLETTTSAKSCTWDQWRRSIAGRAKRHPSKP